MEEKITTTEFTDEQQDALDKMLWLEARCMEAFNTLRFLEKELGMVHRLTCKYRKEVIPALHAESNASKEVMDSTGTTAVLFARVRALD